jgi:hypothetical protein
MSDTDYLKDNVARLIKRLDQFENSFTTNVIQLQGSVEHHGQQLEKFEKVMIDSALQNQEITYLNRELTGVWKRIDQLKSFQEGCPRKEIRKLWLTLNSALLFFFGALVVMVVVFQDTRHVAVTNQELATKIERIQKDIKSLTDE